MTPEELRKRKAEVQSPVEQTNQMEEKKIATYSKTQESDVEYSMALDVYDTAQNLLVDIVKPNHERPRALFICNHGGGGFIGNKKGGMHPMFDEMVTGLGITVAYPNYRLADVNQFKGKNIEQSTKLMWEELYRALSDNYALIRFLLKNNDRYNIDPKQIWIGGVSFGAVIGMQGVCWDHSEYESVVDTVKWANNSHDEISLDTEFGVPEIKGCIALSGAVFTHQDIDPTDKTIIQWVGLLDTTLKPNGGSNHRCPYIGGLQVDSDSEYYGNPIHTFINPKAGHCAKVAGDPFASIVAAQQAKLFFLNTLRTLIH